MVSDYLNVKHVGKWEFTFQNILSLFCIESFLIYVKFMSILVLKVQLKCGQCFKDSMNVPLYSLMNASSISIFVWLSSR